MVAPRKALLSRRIKNNDHAKLARDLAVNISAPHMECDAAAAAQHYTTSISAVLDGHAPLNEAAHHQAQELHALV